MICIAAGITVRICMGDFFFFFIELHETRFVLSVVASSVTLNDKVGRVVPIALPETVSRGNRRRTRWGKKEGISRSMGLKSFKVGISFDQLTCTKNYGNYN